MKRIRIILADDQAAVREGLKLLLNGQPDLCVVGEAGTGASTLQLVRKNGADVVVTEMHLPDCTGVELTRRVKRACPAIQVLAFTTFADPSAMQIMFNGQASGYVLKRSSSKELFQAIRGVHVGERYCDPVLAGQVLGKQLAEKNSRGKARRPLLSEREAGVLRLVAWGYTSKEIAARLRLSVKTVETYRVRLQRKLEIKDHPALVRYALLQGWLKAE